MLPVEVEVVYAVNSPKAGDLVGDLLGASFAGIGCPLGILGRLVVVEGPVQVLEGMLRLELFRATACAGFELVLECLFFLRMCHSGQVYHRHTNF